MMLQYVIQADTKAHMYERSNQIILAYYGGSAGFYQRLSESGPDDVYHSSVEARFCVPHRLCHLPQLIVSKASTLEIHVSETKGTKRFQWGTKCKLFHTLQPDDIGVLWWLSWILSRSKKLKFHLLSE
ncbi:unnamed protein product [Lactuca saligna]|uniref:Uncharacterized protein n=1 Tax=Lactuca saligna TaxID=75948 RepID=A0AA36E1A7_LACSI|nr:unnamed protein product [Lactuca saligna]